MKLLLLFLFASSNALALDSLSYSGRLVNANGSPVTGTPDIQFNLSYTNFPATVICTKTITAVPLTKGVFHTKLNYTAANCGGQTLSQVLALVPPGETIALQVTDVTNSKAYTFQAIHSIPSSIMSNIAKTLTQMGASAGQVLTWDGSKWTPAAVSGATGGTVTSVATGTGLTGGPITTTGTISIAAGGVGTTELANAGVTDAKISSGINRTKLLNGIPNYVLVNNASGVISEVAQLPIAQGGTGASTVSGAWTNLGIGSSAAYNYTSCMPGEVSKFIIPGGWSCVVDSDSLDNTKLPLNGSMPMSGALDMNNNFIVGVATATAPGHAANKAYVDAQVSGVNASQWTTSGINIYYNTGNVGVGTTAPSEKLHVTGNILSAVSGTEGALYLGNTGHGLKRISGTNNVELYTTSGNLFISGGNLGVGTTAPSEKLSVAGNIAVSGRIRLQSDNANYVELKAPLALAATLTFNLPGTVGASGNALVTDGAGNLSWATVATSSTTVGGDLTGSIANAQIALGAIVDADISATAAIAQSKISGLTTDLAAKEPTIAAGVATQYWRGDKTWQTLNTTAVSEGTNFYFTKPRVLGTDLAGFVSGAGTVAATDTVLTSIQKLDGNISAVSAAQANYVLKAGDTMSGALVLSADPAVALGAATKQYVDSKVATGSNQWTESAGNVYRATGNVGIGITSPAAKLHVAGDIISNNSVQQTLTRTLPMVVNNAIDIGSFTVSNGGGSFWITVTVPSAGYSVSKMYILPVQYATTGWKIAQPISDTGNYSGNNFALDASMTNNILALRLRTTGTDGTNVGTAYVVIKQEGNAGTFSASSAITTVTVPTDFFATTSISQMNGNVGIGTTSPVTKLDVTRSDTSNAVARFSQLGVADSTLRISAQNNTYLIFEKNDGTTHTPKWGLINGYGGTDLFTVHDYGAGLARLAITPTGNIGIGTITPGSKLDVAGDVALTGKVRMKSDNANFVELRAPLALASTQTLTLPGTAGSSGNALITDGLGNLSWSAVATTSTAVGGDLTGTIANAQLAAGAIVDADVSATAAIAQSKIANLTTDLAAKEPTIAAGVAAQYWRGDKTWQTLNTTAVPEGTNLYFLDARVRTALMSTYAVGTAMPLAITDNLIEALGKLEAQIIANKTAFDNTGQWSKNATSVYYNGGNVGIGTTTPSGYQHGGTVKIVEAFNAATAVNSQSQFIVSSGSTDPNSAIGGITAALPNSTATNKGVGYAAFTTGSASTAANPSSTYVIATRDISDTNWVARFFIKENGNVGIGSTTPTSALHVETATAADQLVLKSTAATGQTFMRFSDLGGEVANFTDANGTNTAGGLTMQVRRRDATAGLRLFSMNVVANGAGTAANEATMSFTSNTYTDSSFATLSTPATGSPAYKFMSNGSTLATIAHGGNVGIGTTSPATKLQIPYEQTITYPTIGNGVYGALNLDMPTSGTSTGISFNATTAGPQAGIYVYQHNSPGTTMHFATTDSYATGQKTRMTILNTGNVGIGTTTPTAKLEVAGDIKAVSGGRIGVTKIAGTFGPGTTNIPPGTYTYIGDFITLTPGEWVVYYETFYDHDGTTAFTFNSYNHPFLSTTTTTAGTVSQGNLGACSQNYCPIKSTYQVTVPATTTYYVLHLLTSYGGTYVRIRAGWGNFYALKVN